MKICKKIPLHFEKTRFQFNWLVSRIAVKAETVNVTAHRVGYKTYTYLVAIGLSSIFRYSHQTNYHCLCSFSNEIHVSNVLSSCKFQVKHSLLRRRVLIDKVGKICSQTKRIRHPTCSFLYPGRVVQSPIKLTQG